MQSTDVFVIGGGPAGLAAAIAARRRGLDVIVADGARPPIDKACGEGLMPDGLATLKQLGISIDAGAGHPFRGIRFLGVRASVEADFPEGCGLGVRRTVLHEAMVRAASEAGVRLCWGMPVTGVADHVVHAAGGTFAARWMVGADGFHSRVRRWAGLDQKRTARARFGFRMHYRVAPWSEHMELYWGRDCQIYVTPAASDEVCVAVISRNPHLRLEDALPQLPDLRARLAGASNISIERGAITTTSKLARVEQGSIALVGDASGSVDAITGEGLCLAFRQALALADGMAAGSLAEYQARHRRLGRRARFMSHAMLALDGRSWLCDPVLRLMSARPVIFRKLLALHVGAKLPSHFTGVPACVQET